MKHSQVLTHFLFIDDIHQHALDDATRENWEKYGNPDGPQAMSVGIALPSWLIRKDNTFIGIPSLPHKKRIY